MHSFTAMDLYISSQEVEGNKGEKILLIDVMKSNFDILKLGDLISKTAEDFYNEEVIVRVRECIDFPVSDENNLIP